MLRLGASSMWLACVALLASSTAGASEDPPVPEQEADGEPSAPDGTEPGESEPVEPVGEIDPESLEGEAVPLDADEVEALPDALPLEGLEKRARKAPSVSRVFSDDLEIRYWMMPDRLLGFEDLRVLDYVEAVNRFTANVTVGKWSFYGQVDGVMLAANSYFLDDVRLPERNLMARDTFSILIPGNFDPTTHGMEGYDLFSRNIYFNPEKLRLGYEGPKFSFQLGDFYSAFGRGIALNANRNVDIDIDTSIQGFRGIWRPGAWDIQALFGQLNRQQVFQDNPNRGLFGDRRHMVGGLRIDRYGLGPVNLGAHGVVYNFVTDEGWAAGFENMGTTPDVVVGGGSIEVVGAGPTDIFIEADGFAAPSGDVFAGEEAEAGYAVYASTAIYAGKTTWLIEGKRYKDAQRINALLGDELYQIAIAPTLEYERQITEDSAAAVNSNDIFGGRIRMDYTAIPAELVPYVSLSVFRDNDDSPLHFNRSAETIFHPMVGLEWTKDAWAILFNMGYRVDLRDVNDGVDLGSDRHLHGDLLAKLPIKNGWAFDVSAAAEWYRWGVNPVQQTDYVEAETAFALQYKNLVTLIWYTDYSSNPLIDSVGNLSPTVYGAGEIKVQPLPNLTVRAFFGAYKSGIRCSGGQCRVLPGFEGGRVSLTTTF